MENRPDQDAGSSRASIAPEHRSWERKLTVIQHLALHYWRRAAELGDAQSQFNLGRVMSQKALLAGEQSGAVVGNHGEPQSPGREQVEAAKWYALASKQGHSGAQNELGCLHWTGGRGVPKSLQKAVGLWEAASSKNHVVAQKNLRRALEAEGLACQRLAAAAPELEMARVENYTRR